MISLTNDQVGRLAELIVGRDLSQPVRGRYRRPLFRATSLCEKYPTADFIVDVLDRSDESLGFFFVQVKGTATVTPPTARLLIDVSVARFNRLVRLSAPTYLIGVDVIGEFSYIVAAHKARTAPVSSITRAFCLHDEDVTITLYREVLAFWKANRPILHQTRFKDV